MKKILMLTAAIMALQALPALAGEKDGHKGGKHMNIFEIQDADKDGFVTKEEFMKFSEARFAESDSDKDGKVSKQEVKAQREKWEAKRKEMRAEKAKAKEGKAPAAAPAEAPKAE